MNNTSLSQTTLNRLTEILCVYTIQAWLESTQSENDQIRALADPKTRLVLEEIHQSPAANWSVEIFAQLVGQSRTAFSSQFKLAMGVSPMRYVRQRRIRLSCKMLETGNMSMGEVAFKSGYSDTNAFNRAFKREVGVSPGVIKNRSQKAG